MSSVCAKFSYRERHGAKYVAGVILLNGSAFLFGNAILGCRDKILRGTHDANDGKDTKRNGQVAITVMLVKTKR